MTFVKEIEHLNQFNSEIRAMWRSVAINSGWFS